MGCENECRGLCGVVEVADWLSAMLLTVSEAQGGRWRGRRVVLVEDGCCVEGWRWSWRCAGGVLAGGKFVGSRRVPSGDKELVLGF